jgi:hypothetical protein
MEERPLRAGVRWQPQDGLRRKENELQKRMEELAGKVSDKEGDAAAE